MLARPRRAIMPQMLRAPAMRTASLERAPMSCSPCAACGFFTKNDEMLTPCMRGGVACGFFLLPKASWAGRAGLVSLHATRRGAAAQQHGATEQQRTMLRGA